jgi:hypothetical protein
MTAESFQHRDMSDSVFRDVSLRRSVFDDVNMAEVTIRRAYLANLSIDDADITGMTVFGIRIDLLVEAELDRRDPWRARLRMADPQDPVCVRAVLEHLGRLRGEFSTLLRSATRERLTARPAPDRWSAVENLRHMLFVEELYTNRWLLRNGAPWSRLGLVADFLAGNPTYADVGGDPTDDLDGILAAWEAIHSCTLEFAASATREDLLRDTREFDPGQPTAGRVLQGLVRHTHSHIRQAECAMTEPGRLPIGREPAP